MEWQMRYRRNRMRRRRATWAYADARALVTSSGGGNTITSAWILPPARVQYLCDTDRVSTITFEGCHLWLDFWWSNTGVTTGIPDVDFYIIKSEYDDAGQSAYFFNPWQEPSLPAAITAWTETPDEDGTGPFLWCHHIKGQSPPNSQVLTYTDSSSIEAANQCTLIHSGSVDSPIDVCRKFQVAAEWQPDVVVKTKRRLQKSEGILLVMSSPGVADSVRCNLSARFRTLVRRGR